MRDFFINALDKLISVFVVLGIIGVIIGAGMAMMTPPEMGGAGAIGGLIFLVVGLLYVAFMAGFMYLGLGIYHNTRRTADATEKMAGRSA